VVKSGDGSLCWSQPPLRLREDALDAEQELDAFLAGVERRALRMAEFATRNRDDALEIVQEAMFALARRYAKRSPETWPPLFHRILQNGIRDWHRRHARQAKQMRWFGRGGDEQDEVEAVPASLDHDPLHQLGLSDAGRRLVDALQKLPLRQQQVFVLRVWEGLDVKATAEAMGCSSGSVKTHYARANTKLKAELEGYWP